MTKPVSPHAKGVRLAVRLAPGASKNRFGQIEKSADGRAHLKAWVTTVPEDGKANKALIKMLAKALRVPAGKISVASGPTNRNKQILIEGDSRDLARQIDQWIKELTP